MYAIGLTGGIGSGKSQVADFLEGWGVGIIDTDRIAHELTAPGSPAMAPLVQAFGAGVLAPDGSMDRAWMRERAFHDAAVRLRLEAILHPLIERSVWQQAQVVRGPYCVVVVPLLVESGRWHGRVDRICVVDCDPVSQVRRVQARSGLTADTIERIMTAQASRDERLAVADDVILNDGATDLDTLRTRTQGFHEIWCGLAARCQAGRTTPE